MPTKTTFYLSPKSLEGLYALAYRRGYIQSRGPGAGRSPSASQFVDALAQRDLLAVGPFEDWVALYGALVLAAGGFALDEEQKLLVEQLADQIAEHPAVAELEPAHF